MRGPEPLQDRPILISSFPRKRESRFVFLPTKSFQLDPASALRFVRDDGRGVGQGRFVPL